VHIHLIHDSLIQPHSPLQTAARLVQPFLPGRCHMLPARYNAPPIPPNLPLPWGSGSPSNTRYPFAHQTHHSKRHIDRLSRFFRIHCRYKRTGRTTDRQTGVGGQHDEQKALSGSPPLIKLTHRQDDDVTRPARTSRLRYSATRPKNVKS